MIKKSVKQQAEDLDENPQKEDDDQNFNYQENDSDIIKRNTSDTEGLNQQQGEYQTDGQLFKKDFGNFILLNILYLYEGLIVAFFQEYVRNYLIQVKQIKGEQIAALRGIIWPYSIKFLWAPFMDTYYIRSFGRRKTYVVPSLIIISIILFVTAFYFEDWIENIEIGKISTVGIICVFLLTIYDIAVDSWSITLLHERNIAYASFSQSFGYKLGNILGYQLFIYLSDEALMNKLFNYDGKLLTPFSMCIVMGISMVSGILFIIFFRKENSIPIESSFQISSNLDNQDGSDIELPNKVEQQQKQTNQIQKKEEGLKKIISNITCFFKNKWILIFLLFMLTNTFGLTCVDVPVEIVLLSKGFSRSILATIELCLIPLTQAMSVLAAKLSQKKLEFTIWIWCFVIKCFWNIGFAYIADQYQEGQTDKYLALIAILSIVDTILVTLPGISICAFFLRICDQSIGGTYITFMYSFYNLGDLWSSVLITALSSYLSLFTLLIIGSIYNIAIIIFWRRRVIELQNSDKQNWLIQKQQ